MTVLRPPLYLPARPPYDEIKIGRGVRAQHWLDLARLANLCATQGGLVFFLGQPGNADNVGAGLEVRTMAPMRAWGGLRLYSVYYEAPPVSGTLKLSVTNTAGTGAPANVADEDWANGIEVDVVPSERRAVEPLRFLEVVDFADWTYPSAGQQFVLNLYWSGGSASNSLPITGISCHELDRRLVNDVYGIDPEPFDSRRPIFSGSAAGLTTGGVRQLQTTLSNIAEYGCRRFLWGDYKATLISETSHTYTTIYPLKILVHPRRTSPRDPGWSYAPVTIWAYAKDSSDGGNLLITSDYDTTGVTLGGFGTSYEWRSTTLNCYCEAGFTAYPWEDDWEAATVSAKGLQTGQAAGDDTDAETNRTSALEDGLVVKARGKQNSGDAANTFDCRAVVAIQE